MSQDTNIEHKVAVRNSLIPDHLIDLILHWSQWINRKEKRVFLIVDSHNAGSDVNATETDLIVLLEQGVRNPDGSRKFIKLPTEKFVELVSIGSMEYFDPATFIKTELK